MAKKDKKSNQETTLDKVIHKFVKKDRISTYLEKLLNQTHTNFGSLDVVSFDQDDYLELMFLLEESGKQDDKRQINLAVNEVVEQIETLKGQLFFLEKILLDSLGIGNNIPADNIEEDHSATPILDETLLKLNEESESSENVNIDMSSSYTPVKDLDKATGDNFSEDSIDDEN
jgi:hypothetical protein